MTVLVIAEHDNKQVADATYHTITCAQQLSDQVIVLLAGHECQTVADQLAAVQGVSQVLLADNEAYQHALAENMAQLIVECVGQAEHVLAPASTFGKNIMPRVAALLDVAQISDICAVKSADTFIRPIYAGNALATVQSHDKVKVLTVRSTAFAKAGASSSSAEIKPCEVVISAPHTRFVKLEQTPRERPELTTARVVVSGGRGLKNRDNFKLVERLADQLGAAIGASRAAVDAGFVPNDYQVGQTGKVVAPELYIAIGISGAIQHIAGMKDSKVVVAINKDPEAPIFSVADYGLVGDLFEILPQLSDAVEKLQHQKG